MLLYSNAYLNPVTTLIKNGTIQVGIYYLKGALPMSRFFVFSR